jgi:DNA-binding transcriptional MerR regulator
MRGKRLGFSLEEIREMIDLYDVDPTEVAQLRHFIDKIHERKATLERQQADITETLSEISRIEAQCSSLLSDKQKKTAS